MDSRAQFFLLSIILTKNFLWATNFSFFSCSPLFHFFFFSILVHLLASIQRCSWKAWTMNQRWCTGKKGATNWWIYRIKDIESIMLIFFRPVLDPNRIFTPSPQQYSLKKSWKVTFNDGNMSFYPEIQSFQKKQATEKSSKSFAGSCALRVPNSAPKSKECAQPA